MGFKQRIAPLKARILGNASLCPWKSVFQNLHPGTFRAHSPSIQIRVVESSGNLHLLRFADRHDFWFPKSMTPCPALWSEYLVTTWDHRSNAHYYLRHKVTLAQDDVVLDCGACEGFFARQALDLGVTKVLCVEPNVEMASCLQKTFSKEITEGRLLVLPVALGALSGEANFSASSEDAFSGHFDDEGIDRVPIVTLDRLVPTNGTPTMIKMDLEGCEYEALRGGLQLFHNNRPKLAITTYHYPWDHAVISNFLRGVGYRNTRVSSSTLRDGGIPRPVMLHAWR